MGDETLRTAYTLDGKSHQDRVKFNITFITAITNETAFLPAGALNLEELQAIHQLIILFLRKIIAFLKNNCYHDIGNSTKEQGSWCCREEDRPTCRVGACLFSLEYFSYMLQNHDSIKGYGIKESDAINVILFDTVALLNLTEV